MTKLEEEIKELREKVFRYTAARDAAWRAAWSAADYATLYAAWNAARHAALGAAGYPFEDAAKQKEIKEQCNLIIQFLGE